jgi:mRNA interferase MazF
MNRARPVRGDIWLAEFDPVQGHEQGRKRPCIILSANMVNQGASQIVFAVPLTTTNRHNPWHVPILPPEGGLNLPSYALCEHTRSMSLSRFDHSIGRVSENILRKIEFILKALLDFSS